MDNSAYEDNKEINFFRNESSIPTDQLKDENTPSND